MQENLKQLAAQAVDLDKVREERAQEQAAAENAAVDTAVDLADRWDRAMNRAFKGIMPRPARHRMLKEMSREADRA